MSNHQPLKILNTTGSGIRTMTVCSCEWGPSRGPATATADRNAYNRHLRALGLAPLPRADVEIIAPGYAGAGMTWTQWRETARANGVGHSDPFARTR